MSEPNIKEIDWAIYELLHQESSFGTYAKLADLYAVRDHLKEEKNTYEENSVQAQTISLVSDSSEFLQAIDKKDLDQVFLIIDELMETLKVVNPRAYDSVLRKIERL